LRKVAIGIPRHAEKAMSGRWGGEARALQDAVVLADKGH
jgi:hypothetical protein